MSHAPILPRTAAQRQREPSGRREAVAILGLALLIFFGFEVTLRWRELTTTGADSRTASGSGPTLAAPLIYPSPVVEVRAILELPTATATIVPLPQPTKEPTSALDFCGSPVPGQVCRSNYPTPPPPTPYPLCGTDQEKPGEWCRWPEGE